MTTGGTPTGGGHPEDPYGSGSGQQNWGQQSGDQGYGQSHGQGPYGQEPYPGAPQGHEQYPGGSYGQQYPGSAQGHEPYPGQGYGQEPYPGQGYGQQGFGNPAYGSGYPAAGPGGGPVMPSRVSAPGALSAGWEMFKNNPLPWVLITLASTVASLLLSQLATTDSMGLALIVQLASIAVGMLFQAFTVRGALLEVDGHKPGIGDFFKLHNFGWFVVAAILVFIASLIGFFALIIGMFVVLFFLYWTQYFVIDRNMTATDAIISSFNAIKSDAGNLLALALLNVLVIFAGAIALMVGLLVAIPVTTLASVFAYRVITGPSDFSRTATTTA